MIILHLLRPLSVCPLAPLMLLSLGCQSESEAQMANSPQAMAGSSAGGASTAPADTSEAQPEAMADTSDTALGGTGGMPTMDGSGGGGGTASGGTSAGGQGGTGGMMDAQDPAAELDGFRWEMGCTEARAGNLCALFPPNETECPADGYFAQDEQLQFGGEPGTVYEVTLHIQGTGEAGDYSGGQADPEEFLIGATHQEGLHNLMSLEVSAPMEIYFPNAGANGGSVQVYDYMTTIPIEGGATLTFKTYDSDCLHHRYCEDGNTDPCVGLSIPDIQDEPFDGAFLQISVVSVEAQ